MELNHVSTVKTYTKDGHLKEKAQIKRKNVIREECLKLGLCVTPEKGGKHHNIRDSNAYCFHVRCLVCRALGWSHRTHAQCTKKFIGDRTVPREMRLLKGDLLTAIQQGHADDRMES